jgi:hypothetical protein
MELKSLIKSPICDAGFELVVMRRGVPPPPSSFRRAGEFPGQCLANQPGNPESGFIIAEPDPLMLETQLRSASVRPALGAKLR